MAYNQIIKDIEKEMKINFLSSEPAFNDEVYVKVRREDFKNTCLLFHKKLKAPVMMLFAVDETQNKGMFKLYCVFESVQFKKWFFIVTEIPENNPEYESLSSEMYSASLFEREIKEMFGLEPNLSPDSRRLNLHDEVWPEGSYPLRKSFDIKDIKESLKKEYVFRKTEGEGVFEVPVGPVHAGIIGPGHFRFSVAGEPIINLEIRLVFTHRGVEKLFENKLPEECLKLSECVSGDSVFAHSWAFCSAVEKIKVIKVAPKTNYQRAIFLELERIYNHLTGIGGIAVDVGFSFPHAYASIMKETVLSLNDKLTGSRYLKGINIIGGISKELSGNDTALLLETLKSLKKDFESLKKMLYANFTFMDRVETTGILNKVIAQDVGITGMAARASGINRDLRKDFGACYNKIEFNLPEQTKGDVLARLNVRISEIEQSILIIQQCVLLLNSADSSFNYELLLGNKFGLGYVEGWRGPVLYWLKINEAGLIDRCKIVDASFHNWQGLSYCAPGNIVPDFPVCNKSFDLSYSGNDL